VDYTAGTSVSMIIPPPYDYTCDDVIKYAERKSNATVSRCTIAELVSCRQPCCAVLCCVGHRRYWVGP